MFRGLGAGLFVVLSLVAWLLFTPPQVGGSASYAVIDGSSMAPSLVRGDLAIVRTNDDYRVGDVVAYRNERLDQLVLHRVVGHDDDRLVLRGDANDFVDKDRPTRDQVVGTLTAHVPKVGVLVAWLKTPIGMGAIFGFLGASLVSTGVGVNRRRARLASASRSVAGKVTRAAGTPRVVRNRQAALGIAAALTAAFLILGAFAFTRPLTRLGTVDELYTQTGSFDYSASVPPSPLYDSTTLQSGDAIFFRAADRVDVRFDYRFDSQFAHGIAGTASLIVQVSDDRGLARSFPLAPATPFFGDELTLTGSFNARGMRAFAETIERQTGTRLNSLQLAVVAEVEVVGNVGQNELDERFGTPLVFDFGADRLSLAGDAEMSLAETLTTTGVGSGELPEASAVALLGLTLDVELARRIATIGAGAGGLALLFVGVLLIAGRTSDEAALIEARYGDWIVDVKGVPDRSSTGTLEIQHFDDLARIAQSRGLPIVHVCAAGTHTYLVEDGVATYCYRTPADATSVPMPSLLDASESLGAGRLEPEDPARTPMDARSISELESLLDLELQLDTSAEDRPAGGESWLSSWVSLSGRFRDRERT